jgi:hypothetical protein
MAVALLAYHARVRYKLEQAAGQRRLALAPRGNQTGRAAPAWVYVGGGVLIACGLICLLTARYMIRPQPGVPLSFWYLLLLVLFRAFLSAMFIVHGIAAIWWSRSVQLREQGVLRGLRLLRWDHVTNCHWSRWTGSMHLEGVDQRHRDVQIGMSIPSQQLDSVGTVLRNKLPAQFDQQQIHALSYVTPPVPFPLVNGREEVSRGCLVVLVAWIAGTIIASFAGGAQTREFGYGTIAGALACVALAVAGSRQVGRAGGPRIRLNIWLDGPVLLRWATAAGLCYYLGWQYGFTSKWISVPLGVVCGYAFVSAVRVSALDKLDLCENGIVVRRSWFWPWQELRVQYLASRSGGRIEFRHRRRRITAIVPSARLEAVKALCEEKLPLGSGDTA